MRAYCLASLGLALALTATTGCRALDRQRYNDLLRVDAAVDRPTSACGVASDADVDAGSCTPARIPARPPSLVDRDGGTRSMVFGMRRVVFGLGSRAVWNTIGFDRDNRCTDPSASDPMPGCAPRMAGVLPAEDGDHGRDNALSSQLGTALTATYWNEADTNTKIERGDGTAGLRITEYGGAEDGRVVLEWLPLVRGHAAGSASDPPRFDGHDGWAIDRAIAYDSAAPGRALVRAENAFVTCGTLVAPLPSRVPLRFKTASRVVQLTMSGGVFVGAIADDGASIGPLDFSGYWAVADALRDLATLGICPPPPDSRNASWRIVTNAIESAADLLSTGETAPSVQCDAVSAAFRTEWVPIELDPDVDVPPPPDLCAFDAGVDASAPPDAADASRDTRG